MRPDVSAPVKSRITVEGKVLVVLASEEVNDLAGAYCTRLSLGWGAL